MTTPPVITIDGPSGAGKGTASQLVASRLGWHFLDSGAIYRALALAALQQHIDENDTESLVQAASGLDLRFEVTNPTQAPQVFLGETEVSQAIRHEDTGTMASKISKYQDVRQALLSRQQAFCQAPGLVADGRDMGTAVFPDAPVKVFLTASQEERAQRRYKQLREQGENVSLAQVLTELAERDRRDTNRTVNPLRPADDAVVIDTTSLSIDDVVAAILGEAETKLGIAI
ncbi:MAG: cytidylate kinase [Legionellales bacterium]|nr:cytidylate kinase [Legionellales bacterium]|tara:strand:- start:8954 stop:9643 length:690 start_codon:yes stop_codon:yes gene_type:complete